MVLVGDELNLETSTQPSICLRLEKMNARKRWLIAELGSIKNVTLKTKCQWMEALSDSVLIESTDTSELSERDYGRLQTVQTAMLSQ